MKAVVWVTGNWTHTAIGHWITIPCVVLTVPEYFPLWQAREQGKRVIGCTVWGNRQAPPALAGHTQRSGRLDTAVPYEPGTFLRGMESPHPITVVPYPVGAVDGPELGSYDRPGFTFYTINTWIARKALDRTLTCYLKTFQRDDPVVLIIKTTRWDDTRPVLRRFYRSTADAVRKIKKNFRNPARVKLMVRGLDQGEMRQLHARGDCYLSLTRGEGWGFGAFDAALQAKPVVITGFGGQLDFLPPDLAYLVDYRLVTVDLPGNGSYTPDQHWAEADLEDGSRLLRQVFENREAAQCRGEALRRYVLEEFSEAKVLGKFMEALE